MADFLQCICSHDETFRLLEKLDFSKNKARLSYNFHVGFVLIENLGA